MCTGDGNWSIIAHAALLALTLAVLGGIAAALDRWEAMLVRFGCHPETAAHLRASAKWLLIIDICLVLVDAAVFSVRTVWGLVQI